MARSKNMLSLIKSLSVSGVVANLFVILPVSSTRTLNLERFGQSIGFSKIFEPSQTIISLSPEQLVP